MSDDKSGKYDLEKDLFGLQLKSTINALREMPFEEFLKSFFEISPCIPASLAFGRVVCDAINATGYAFNEKDAEMLNLVGVLVAELEKESSSVSKAFASLIKKAIRLNEAGIPITQISGTFEFGHIVAEFDKFAISLEKTPEEPCNLGESYSDN